MKDILRVDLRAGKFKLDVAITANWQTVVKIRPHHAFSARAATALRLDLDLNATASASPRQTPARDDVRFRGKIGSHGRTIKMTRMTQSRLRRFALA